MNFNGDLLMNSIIGFEVNSNCLKNREPFRLGVGHNNFEFISLLKKENFSYTPVIENPFLSVSADVAKKLKTGESAFIYLDVLMDERHVFYDPDPNSERRFIFLQCCTNIEDYIAKFSYIYLQSVVIDNDHYHLFEICYM